MGAIEVIPSAKRLIKSLRDIGYDFSQAVADIVDNSIEATASVVTIDVDFDGKGSRVRIADNGNGMKPDQLREAMRYGSDREYDAEDLGKFGLGLKTASMSQCRRLSVASRWNPERADISAYSWDLEHIERTNRWEILPLDRTGSASAIWQPLKETTGTVVFWQGLDRILGYKHPDGESARKGLLQICREIEQHLAMVFHRFLSGEARGHKFKILFNGNEVKPWDPFCLAEQKTKKLSPVSIPVEHEGVSGKVLVEPFVLPHQDDFSSPDAFRRAGLSNWNQQQGFYIYRSDRMIQSGGWSNLRAPDEHTKLARVSIRFSPKLDAAFSINVAKMRAQIPSVIRESVREAIGPVLKIAREVYDRKAAKLPIHAPPKETPPPAVMAPYDPIPDVATIGVPGDPHSQGTVTGGSPPHIPMLSLEEWSQRLLTAATDQERPVIEAVLERLHASSGN